MTTESYTKKDDILKDYYLLLQKTSAGIVSLHINGRRITVE